jgi:hypothetical protein
MKIRSLLALVGLAISFPLPTLAQQTNTPDPQLRQALGQTALLVTENPGDLSQLVESKTIDEPEDSLFYFQNILSNPTGAKWEFSSNSTFLPLLGSSAFEPPAKGRGKIIPVNWKNLVPANPAAGTKYYFRVVSYQGRVVLVSNTAVITIKKSDSMVDSKPEMGVTVRMKNPNLFFPMPIEINLKELQIAKSNENSDEPYLLVAAVYVDGTTIKPLALSRSTVRVDPPRKVVNVGDVLFPTGPPRKTHGNVALKDENGDDLATWSVAKISPDIGHFEASIKPIGLDLVAGIEDPIGAVGDRIKEGTAVFVVVVAMEKDDTPTETIDKAYDTMILELQNHVNGIVQKKITLHDLVNGNISKFDSKKIANELSDKVISCVKHATLTSLCWLPPIIFGNFLEVVDPDDYVGFAFARFSFGQILRAGKDGITFAVICERKDDYNGTYNVFGNIRRK